MKFYIGVLIGLLFVSASAFGALSADDYEKLNAMFKDSEARTQQAIEASEARMKEYVSHEISREIAKVNVEIAKVNGEIGKLSVRIDATNTRIDTESRIAKERSSDFNNRLNVILGLLGVLIAIIIGLPLLRDRKKDREQDEQLEAQQQQLEAQQRQLEKQQQELEAMRQELATLKQNQRPWQETQRTP